MPRKTSQPYPVRPVLVFTDVPAPDLPRIPTARVTSATQAREAARRAGHPIPKRMPWRPFLDTTAGEWRVPVIRAKG